MKRLILLRPEPGLSASAAAARSMGVEVVEHPLFTIRAVSAVPPPKDYDGLVLTSANAVRLGGAILDAMRHLPVHAVGDATALAAKSAGLKVVSVGEGGVEGLSLPKGQALLHLAGETHRPIDGVDALVVYRTVPVDAPLPPIGGAVLAVHSAAAGERLDELAGEARGSAQVAAISGRAAGACGAGWAAVFKAPAPDDASLLALAVALCQSGRA